MTAWLTIVATELLTAAEWQLTLSCNNHPAMYQRAYCASDFPPIFSSIDTSVNQISHHTTFPGNSGYTLIQRALDILRMPYMHTMRAKVPHFKALRHARDKFYQAALPTFSACNIEKLRDQAREYLANNAQNSLYTQVPQVHVCQGQIQDYH